jgi:hypothetical protein
MKMRRIRGHERILHRKAIAREVAWRNRLANEEDMADDRKHLGNFDVVQLVDTIKARTAGTVFSPVIICCKWLKGTDGMRRQQNKRDEWRVGELIFEVVKHQAQHLDRKAVLEPTEVGVRPVLFGVPVEYEEFPPDDLISQLIQQRLTG